MASTRPAPGTLVVIWRIPQFKWSTSETIEQGFPIINCFFLTLTSVVGYTPEIWKLGMNSLFHMARVGLGKQHLFFRRGGRPAQGRRTAIVPRIKYVIQYLAEGFPKKSSPTPRFRFNQTCPRLSHMEDTNPTSTHHCWGINSLFVHKITISPGVKP